MVGVGVDHVRRKDTVSKCEFAVKSTVVQIAFFCFFFSAGQAIAAGSACDNWLLRQRSVLGTQDVHISKDRLKIVNRGLDFVLLRLGTGSEIIIYSHSRKMIYKKPFDVWEKSWGSGPRSFRRLDLKPDLDTKCCGLRCSRFVHPRNSGTQYWVSNSLGASKSVNETLRRYYGTPFFEGTPLKLILFGRTGRRGRGGGQEESASSLTFVMARPIPDVLSTLSIERIPDCNFDYPRNYRSVNTTSQFLVDNSGLRMAEERLRRSKSTSAGSPDQNQPNIDTQDW